MQWLTQQQQAVGRARPFPQHTRGILLVTRKRRHMAFPSLLQTPTEYECESIWMWGVRTRNGKEGKPQAMTLFSLLFLVQQAQAGICAQELHSALQLPQGRLQTQG